MNDPSGMSKPQTSRGTHSATSLLASGAGPSHSPSQGGLQLDLFGQALAHASHSAQREDRGERLTNDTSGLSSNASLRSANLQLSLESRLRARLEGRGSQEYALTWKHWPMESGHPICALRASGHRISGNASTGWPTPSANQFEQNPDVWEARRQRHLAKGYNGNGQGATLDIAAHLAGWPTPTALHRPRTPETMAKSAAFRKRNANQNTVPLYLEEAARLAGWATPNAADSWTPPYATENTMRGGDPNGTLRSTSGSLAKDVVMLVLGQTPSASPSSTESGGVLNPELSRWLMGFPEEWGNYAPTATPSSRKSQRNS